MLDGVGWHRTTHRERDIVGFVKSEVEETGDEVACGLPRQGSRHRPIEGQDDWMHGPGLESSDAGQPDTYSSQ